MSHDEVEALKQAFEALKAELEGLRRDVVNLQRGLGDVKISQAVVLETIGAWTERLAAMHEAVMNLAARTAVPGPAA